MWRFTIQHCGGFSVLHGDIISTVDDVQYCMGIPSVLWRCTIQYFGGYSVVYGDIISIVKGYHPNFAGYSGLLYYLHSAFRIPHSTESPHQY